MCDNSLILVHSCQLECLKVGAPTRQRCKVELLTGGQRQLIRLLNQESSVVIEEVETDKIGAAALIKLEQKQLISRKPPRKCLLLFYKSNQSEQWQHLVIVDKERPTAFNCVQQLKNKITEICFASTFQLTSVADKSTHELQFTKSHFAIVPSDGSHQCDNTNVFDLCNSLATGSVFKKVSGDVSLLQDENSAYNCICLKTSSESEGTKSHSYLAVDGKAVEDIIQECACRRGRDPLPPLPVEPLANDNSDEDVFDAKISGCGRVPSIDEPPFWLRVNKVNCRTSSIYGNLPDEYADEILYHERRRQEVCNRAPKRRFKMFVKAVSIKPTMLKAASDIVQRESQRLYETPRVSVTVPVADVQAENFPQDNVESTFASVLRKIVRNTFQPQLEVCPIGLSREERDKFCWRLDLIEHDIVKGPGWKEFANLVMQLDNDDMEMIDEFSCKYKCQVVEVVLDHWHKLHSLKSPKCLQPAFKRTVINVLSRMEKVALLRELKWEINIT